ncbi:MAG: hypothetical protein M1840_001253 [Geoglossum simile]|nr:MAG: hypothetical protein M1840_001253 [Geoglossum simile]
MSSDREDEDDEANSPTAKIEDTGGDEGEDKSKRAYSAESVISPPPQTPHPITKPPPATVSTPVTRSTPSNTTTPPTPRPTLGPTPFEEAESEHLGIGRRRDGTTSGMLGSSLQGALGDADKDMIKVNEAMDELKRSLGL